MNGLSVRPCKPFLILETCCPSEQVQSLHLCLRGAEYMEHKGQPLSAMHVHCPVYRYRLACPGHCVYVFCDVG